MHNRGLGGVADNILASHILGRWFKPLTRSFVGKLVLPYKGPAVYSAESSIMYWFHLLLKLPIMILPIQCIERNIKPPNSVKISSNKLSKGYS